MSCGTPIAGAVYVLTAPGTRFVKFGVTVPKAYQDANDAVQTRFWKVQRGCPLRLKVAAYAFVDDALTVEQELLRQFARYRVYGEWAKLPKPLAAVHALRLFAE